MIKTQAIAQLRECLEGLAQVRSRNTDGMDYQKWRRAADKMLRYVFGEKASQVSEFGNVSFYLGTGDEQEDLEWFEKGIREAQALLEGMIDEIDRYWPAEGRTLESTASQEVRPDSPRWKRSTKKVFVVHGRDLATRDAMFTFLRALTLEPIEWSQAVVATGKAMPYIGEVLDAAFGIAQAVVVLMTPDEEVRLKPALARPTDLPHDRELTAQARPNVLFEAGMAMGRCAERTILVEFGTLRPFSDIGGRHVIRMDGSSQRRQELAQRLQAARCDVDLSGTDWHTTGSFRA